MRRSTLHLLPLVALVLFAPPASAQMDGGRCAERFPEAVFDHHATAGPVDLYGSEVPAEILDRYGRDYTVLVEWIQDEMGGLGDGVVICMFEDQIPLDAQSLGWPEGQALRAAAFGEERMIVLSNWLIQHVPDAGYNGLLHVAQYQVSDGDYPQTFGNEVKGWYRNRIDRTVEVVHNVLVRQNSGLSEPWPPTPWVDEAIADPLLWNPEFGYGGGGDFANFAVANGGNEILSDPRSTDVASLDEQWRQALFDESGAVLGGSRGWIKGLVISIGIVLLGVLMALWNRHQKRVIEEKLRDLPWLEEQARLAHEQEAVRTSVAVGGRGRNARVGGSDAGPGFDGDDRDGTPTGRPFGRTGDGVSGRRQAGDDLFRHPDFDDHG